MEEEVSGAVWFFFSVYLLNLNFVSEIETYTLWKLTYRKSHPRDIEFAQATAEIVTSIETDGKYEKCYPPSCKGADMLPSQIPTVPSPFDFHASFKIDWMWWPWGWHYF